MLRVHRSRSGIAKATAVWKGSQRIILGGSTFRGWLEFKFDYNPHPLTLVCQSCGQAWAWMIPDGATKGFAPVNHLCADCGGGDFASLNLEYRYFEIPDGMLVRECELWSQHGDRYAGTVYV